MLAEVTIWSSAQLCWPWGTGLASLGGEHWALISPGCLAERRPQGAQALLVQSST
jgi:hypothetical protein